MKTLEEKIQTCNLCDALVRNIDDNFISVSFLIAEDGNIQIKFILSELTDKESDYIDDTVAEFTAKQSIDCVLPPLIELPPSLPLANIVYAVRDDDI